MIRLVSPAIEHQEEVMRYREEFIKNNDSMDGTAGLRELNDYASWLNRIKLNASKATVLKGLVPATTLLAIRESDNYIVGMIDIRHELNEYLYNFGGHIGYSVRKSERRKGYATEILKCSLEVCKKLEMDKILVCCLKDNIASARTIISNDGILENEVDEDGAVVQRYWIGIGD